MHEVNLIIDSATTNSDNPKAAKRHSRRCGSDRIETDVRKARPADKAAKAPKAKGKNRSQDLWGVSKVCLVGQGQMPQEC